jgi:zinc protease
MTKNAAKTVVSLVVVALLARQAPAEKLPSDPRILSGQLANGATWMYRQHDNPPGKMALLLHVDTGSLNETESQRGLAHFMEHMAFNGSENFPPGELIPYFESIGMEFGADLNAFTSFDQTCYMIFLPDTASREIDKALMVLSDQAFRCLLLEEEIEKERGVILEEKSSGMNAGERIRNELWPELFAGSRFADRMPIGTEEVIKGAPRSEFINYYRTWYRPERVTLMMVGDADLKPVLPLVEKWFGQYKPTMPAAGPRGAEFKPFTQQRAIVVTDPEYAQCQVAMYNIRPGRPPTTTVAQARTDLVEHIGSWIVSRRFHERVQKGEASYHTASVGVANFFNEALLIAGMASGEPQKWEKMLEELVVEVSRAQQYGFTPREFDLAKTEITAGAERAVRTEPTRNARRLLFEMNRAVTDREPIQSAEQELELIRRLLPTIELSEVSAAFAKNFKPGTFAYVLTMVEKEDVTVPPREEVLGAARAALARKLEPPKEEQRATELLATLPEPGRTVEKQADEELAITSLWLDNGVRVHHRFMDYKKDLVLITISLAGGRIEEAAGNAGVTEVAALVFDQPATRHLASTEITDIMTGKNIDIGGHVGGDALVVRVSGSPEDLEAGLQLAHVLLTGGKIEESAFKNWRETSLQQYETYSKYPRIVAFREMQALVSGDDPRVMVLDPERIKAQSRAAAQAWLERLCAEAPIEVAVVGEIRLDAVLPLMERYLGSLPERPRSAAYLDPLRTLKRPEGPLARQVTVETMNPQAMVICGFAGTEARNTQDVQALELATQTLTSRLIKRVREELSLVYTVVARSVPAEVYRDAGLFLTLAPCTPGNADQVTEEVRVMLDAFAESGPTTEELDNARKQVLNNLDTQMKEPQFWLDQLQHADLHDVDLARLKRLEQSYAAFTAEQVREVFCEYYTPARTFRVTATPAKAQPETATDDQAQQAAPAVP